MFFPYHQLVGRALYFIGISSSRPCIHPVLLCVEANPSATKRGAVWFRSELLAFPAGAPLLQ
jgi:hypothetical protein